MEIVVYCNGGDCEDSESAALFLLGLGADPERIRVFTGGITEWTERGMPLEQGSQEFRCDVGQNAMSASDHTALRRLDATGLPLLLSRLVLGGMFIWLGASKISDPISFLKLIREYGLVPPDMSVVLNGMAVALPWLEIWCGVLLLLGVAIRGAGASTLLLLCIFSFAILLRALDIYATGGAELLRDQV